MDLQKFSSMIDEDIDSEQLNSMKFFKSIYYEIIELIDKRVTDQILSGKHSREEYEIAVSTIYKKVSRTLEKDAMILEVERSKQK